MTTESHIALSIKRLFTSPRNVRKVSEYIGRNALADMTTWLKTHNLDDSESISGDMSESLDYANATFVKVHKKKGYEVNMANGTNFPKYYIDEGVEYFNVDDWRSYDAQTTQEVFRTNDNFRYGNAIKKWEIGLHARHYDRAVHEQGLPDIRELDTIQRGYNMEKIYGPNEYESSDSILYNY